jgi:hypothetical protein
MYTSIRIEVKSGQKNYLKNDQQNLIKKNLFITYITCNYWPHIARVQVNNRLYRVERGQNASSAIWLLEMKQGNGHVRSHG